MSTTPLSIPCSTWTRTPRRLSAPQTVSVSPSAVPGERGPTSCQTVSAGIYLKEVGGEASSNLPLP